MSQQIGTPGKSCECWAPVLGTMLILIGLFDLGFASLTAAASIELGRLAGVVAESSTLITFGHAFSQMSGGLLDIG